MSDADAGWGLDPERGVTAVILDLMPRAPAWLTGTDDLAIEGGRA